MKTKEKYAIFNKLCTNFLNSYVVSSASKEIYSTEEIINIVNFLINENVFEQKELQKTMLKEVNVLVPNTFFSKGVQ